MRAGHCREPGAIGDGVEPGNCDDWLLRMIEVDLAPVGRWRGAGCAQKPRVFPNRDLGCRHGKGIYPNTMHRAFYVLTVSDPIQNQPAAMGICKGSATGAGPGTSIFASRRIQSNHSRRGFSSRKAAHRYACLCRAEVQML